MKIEKENTIKYKKIMYKKHFNYFFTLFNLIRRSAYLKTYPFLAFINPTTICNYKCPYCAKGNDTLGVGSMYMPLSLFKKIINEIGEYLLQLNLFFYGEPFINKDIFEMIKYAKKYYIYTRINTNFSNFNDEMLERLILSGLDQIVFSLDGISQKTYEKYRIGGDFNNVFDNVKKLIYMKKKLNSNKPKTTWQFLIFKHNINEIETARQMCFSMGLDNFWLLQGNTPDTEDGIEMRAPDYILEKYNLKRNNELETRNSNLKCHWTWGQLIVNADGKISPCCTYHENTDIFGDFSKKTFKEIWNSDAFISARRYFSYGKKKGPNIFCYNCPIEEKCRLFMPLDHECKTFYLKIIDKFVNKISKI